MTHEKISNFPYSKIQPELNFNIPNISNFKLCKHIEIKKINRRELYSIPSRFTDNKILTNPISQIYNLYCLYYYMTYKSILTISDEFIYKLYHDITGYKRYVSLTSKGITLERVLIYLAEHELHTVDYIKGSSILLGRIKINNVKLIQTVLSKLGPLCATIKLLETDLDRDLRQVFDTLDKDRMSFIRGYMTIVIIDFKSISQSGEVTITFSGKIITVTWEWLMYRLCDSYVILFDDLISVDTYIVWEDEFVKFINLNAEFLCKLL